MKYYKYLYVGESVHFVDRIKAKINKRSGLIGKYILYFSKDGEQLEIMNGAYLKLPYYAKHPLVIVGIAGNYNEAINLVQRIIEESLKETGKASIKDYLISRTKAKD